MVTLRVCLMPWCHTVIPQTLCVIHPFTKHSEFLKAQLKMCTNVCPIIKFLLCWIKSLPQLTGGWAVQLMNGTGHNMTTVDILMPYHRTCQISHWTHLDIRPGAFLSILSLDPFLDETALLLVISNNRNISNMISLIHTRQHCAPKLLMV